MLTAFKATAVGGTRVKSVWDTERERERERVYGYVAGQASIQPTERERERDGERACEGRRSFTRKRVSEATLVREKDCWGARREKSSTPET